jgi:hypothetical protein
MAAGPTTLPKSIERVRQRLEHWRQTRTHRHSRIPDPLWAAAVAIARQHGLSVTARLLRLDYTALKRRVAAATGRAETAPPTFIELPPPPAGGECLIELEAPRGGTLRVQIKGAVPDLVALSRMVWTGRS